MKPYLMKQVIDRMTYNTETATLISGDDYWDGNNWERSGTNTFLYRTKNGRYFSQYQSQWQGDNDRLIAMSESEAIVLYEQHQIHGELREECFEDAFPGVEISEA